MSAPASRAPSAWRAAIHRLGRHRVATLAVLALVGVLVWQGVRRARGVEVAVVVAERRLLIQNVVTTGRVRPRRIRLAPLGAGKIIALDCAPGASVAAGHELVRLDDREAQAQLDHAQAQLAAAEASAHELRSFSQSQADEALAQARTHLEQATRDRERVERLTHEQAATTENLEKVTTAQRLAESEVRDAEAERAALAAGGPRRRSAEATLSQARAAVAVAEAQLDHTRIVAPVAAVVMTCDLELGDTATTGATIIELAAQAGTELVVEPDERNLALLRLGQPALASAEAFPAQTFPATVSFIAPAVDRRRGTIEVRLAVAAAPAYLRPDMTVSVEIEISRQPDALVVPIAAVHDLAATPWLLVVEDGRTVRRPVEIGRRGDDAVEVVHGLVVGEQVVPVAAHVGVGDRVRVRP